MSVIVLLIVAGGAAAFVAGLLPYLYRPVRARMNPPVDWRDPATLEQPR